MLLINVNIIWYPCLLRLPLTTRVGNAQEISGIATFTTAQEAIEQINSWNANLRKLMICTERVTREVRTNWNMEVLVKRSIETLCRPMLYQP